VYYHSWMIVTITRIYHSYRLSLRVSTMWFTWWLQITWLVLCYQSSEVLSATSFLICENMHSSSWLSATHATDLQCIASCSRGIRSLFPSFTTVATFTQRAQRWKRSERWQQSVTIKLVINYGNEGKGRLRPEGDCLRFFPAARTSKVVKWVGMTNSATQ
jgi:hypothetical protein